MQSQETYVGKLTHDMLEAAGRAEWDAVRARISILASRLAAMLIKRRTNDIAKAYDTVEKAYTVFAATHGLRNDIADAASLGGELRALTRLCSAAVRFPQENKAEELLLAGTYRPLMEALLQARHGLSCKELAKKVKTKESTVARKLPELREHKLIESHQVGRSIVNTLPPEIRKFAAKLYAQKPKVTARLKPPVEDTKAILKDIAHVATILNAFAGSTTVKAEKKFKLDYGEFGKRVVNMASVGKHGQNAVGILPAIKNGSAGVIKNAGEKVVGVAFMAKPIDAKSAQELTIQSIRPEVSAKELVSAR